MLFKKKVCVRLSLDVHTRFRVEKPEFDYSALDSDLNSLRHNLFIVIM